MSSVCPSKDDVWQETYFFFPSFFIWEKMEIQKSSLKRNKVCAFLWLPPVPPPMTLSRSDNKSGTRHSEWNNVLSFHCTSQCGLPAFFELSTLYTAVHNWASKVISVLCLMIAAKTEGYMFDIQKCNIQAHCTDGVVALPENPITLWGTSFVLSITGLNVVLLTWLSLHYCKTTEQSSVRLTSKPNTTKSLFLWCSKTSKIIVIL